MTGASAVGVMTQDVVSVWRSGPGASQMGSEVALKLGFRV